jgi:lipopolysaccharide heptosyltransferase II
MFDTLRQMARTPKVLDPKRRALILALHAAGRVVLWPFARVGRIPANPPQGILLMRVDGIGDFAMTSALFPALRRAYPDARIDLLCSTLAKPLAEVFANSGDLDHVYAVPLTGRSLAQNCRIVRELRKNRYDVAADLRGDFRNVLAAFLARVPQRYGFSYSGFDYLLTRVIRGPVEQVGAVHQVGEVSQMCELLGAGPLTAGPGIEPPQRDRAFARKWLGQQRRDPDRPLIALHLSAGMPARIWPVQRFIEVARRLAGAHAAQFLVVGAAEDRPLADRFAAGLGEPALIAAGAANLVQSIALLEECDLFIGTDSGPAHMASAVGCPLIVLFGPGNPKVMRPYTDDSRIVRSPRACDRSCNNKTCVASESCMKAITADDVIAAAETLLATRSFGPVTPDRIRPQQGRRISGAAAQPATAPQPQ